MEQSNPNPSPRTLQLVGVMMMEAGDIRELSFQNVVDQILKPNNVKVGGFPDTLFLELSENEKETLICNICFLIVNDARQCKNEHLFCHTCVFAWSLTYGENSQKCPMCRVDQTDYQENKTVTNMLFDRRVACQEDKCTFKAPLKVFLMHGHGKNKYGNSHVDFESLRPPPRPDGARLLVLPSISVSGNTRLERAHSIRSQLHQGRMMIHQMMFLLHLEMQLRQQALTGFQEASDPHTRLRRLDEVMALNEQLNEVGTVLSSLLNSPINNIIAANRAMQDVSGVDTDDVSSRDTSFQALLAASSRSDSPPINRPGDDDSDDNDSDDSDISGIGSALRMGMRLDSRVNINGLTTRNAVGGNISTSNNLSTDPLSFNVNRNHSSTDISSSVLLASNDNRNDANNSVPVDVPTIEEGRHLSDFSQANLPISTDVHPRVLIGRSPQVPNRITPSANNSNTDTTQSSSGRTVANTVHENTVRIANDSNRSTLQTSVNSRNQTLPNLPGASDNNVSGRSVTSRIVPRPPSVSPFPDTVVDQGNLRPLSSQPSEADLPDQNRTIVPNGSSIFNQARENLENTARDGVRNNTNSSNGRISATHSGTSVSWSSGQNAGTTPRPNSVARNVPVNTTPRVNANNATSTLQVRTDIRNSTSTTASRSTNSTMNSLGLSSSNRTSGEATASSLTTPRFNEMGSILQTRNSSRRTSQQISEDIADLSNPDQIGNSVRRRTNQSQETANTPNTTNSRSTNLSSNAIRGVTSSITANRRLSVNSNNSEINVNNNRVHVTTRTRNVSQTRSRMIDARLTTNRVPTTGIAPNTTSNHSTVPSNTTATRGRKISVPSQNTSVNSNITRQHNRTTNATPGENNQRVQHDSNNNASQRRNEPILKARRRSDIRESLLRE